MVNNVKAHDGSVNKLQDSHIKDILRTSMFSDVSKVFPKGKNLNGFTLPGTAYILELRLTEHYGKRLHLTGVESKKSIYDKSVIKKNKFVPNMDLYHTDDLKFFKETDQKFHFMWLDYCGYFSKSKKKSMEQIFSRRIFDFSRNNIGILGLTFLAQREPDGMQEIEISYLDRAQSRGRKTKYDIRISGIPSIIQNIALQHGQSLRPTIVFRYRDMGRAKNANTMIMFMCEVYNEPIDFDVWNTEYIDLVGNMLEI